MILSGVRVPGALCEPSTAAAFAHVDVVMEGARIASVRPHDGLVASGAVDGAGGIALPAFVDLHTHLDKAHIAPRAQNPDGTFGAALRTARADRRANWTADDIERRMEFALASAYAHGTAAIRTHIDSEPPQDAITWPVFARLRDRWAGRIALQAVSLEPIEAMPDDPSRWFDRVACHGGLVGAAVYPTADVRERIAALIGAAEDRGSDLDLHVDETIDPSSNTLAMIADAALAVGFSGTITCGHCCSLMTMADDAVDRTLDRVAEAGLSVVTLPLCNAYLQDRGTGRTPRIRGGTLVHEMAARGIPVAIASDNVRDPFHAYGDLDLVEVYREATRSLHLDHPVGDWPRAVTSTPAAIMGLADRDRIGAGAPADLVLFSARSWDEFFARPQSDRTVVRGGMVVAAAPLDYGALDGVAGASEALTFGTDR